MEFRATQQGDVSVPGEPEARALFAGQVYDLPEAVGAQYEWLERVTATAPAPEPESEPSPRRARGRARKRDEPTDDGDDQ